MRPRIIIIAGPNGAGKTTFAREFLPQEASCPVFVNADLLAAGLSPFQPEAAAIQAGRLMLQLLAQHVSKRESFAFETTLSGRGYARQIPQWRKLGYSVELYFLSLPDADFAVNRVAERVRQGGHHIPEATIRRRFESGWKAPINRSLIAGFYTKIRGSFLYCWTGANSMTHRKDEKSDGGSSYSGSINPPTGNHSSPVPDAGVHGANAAILRAAKRARQVAASTGTDLIVMQEGKVVRLPMGDLPL